MKPNKNDHNYDGKAVKIFDALFAPIITAIAIGAIPFIVIYVLNTLGISQDLAYSLKNWIATGILLLVIRIVTGRGEVVYCDGTNVCRK